MNIPRLRATPLAFAAFVAFAPPAAAQAPGYTQIDTRRIFAEFHAEVLTHVNALMDAWGTAWSNDRPDELGKLYWENAVLIPPEGSPRRGTEQLREYFDEALGRQGAMEAFMLDFDASGGMAVVYGNYLLQLQGERPGQELSGPVVTVYLLRGRTWKIRSQVFR